MRTGLLEAYESICNLTRYDIADENIDIAIIDSIYDIDQIGGWDSRIGLESELDLVDSEDEILTTPHGWHIANIIRFYVYDPTVTLHTYRVIQEDRSVDEADFIEALNSARQDDVDIINTSIGFDHLGSKTKQCTSRFHNCAISHEVEKIIEDGISLVAGAGNEGHSEKTASPAIIDEVIGVAGYIPKCGQSEVPRPEGAIWIHPTEKDEHDVDPNNITPLCSMKGCGVGEMCAENRMDVYWNGNSTHEGNKPDVAAPAAIVVGGEGNPYDPAVVPGTSYAAPIVTAQIANWLTVYNYEGIEASPHEIQNGIRESNTNLEDGQDLLLDGIRAFEEIGSPYGIYHEETTSDLYELE